tara:strand:+ start:820 stop:1293 length:474 start_codon:yes stop_codon:yes gene_type:complete
MSFIFFNADGTKLSGSDFASLGSSLGAAGGAEITIEIFNNSSKKAEAPLMFLQPSTSLGSLDYPSKRPSHTDYGDLLLWGSTLDANDNPTAGLYLNQAGTKKYFSFNSGSNYRNGIPLGPIEIDARIDVILGFTPKVDDDVRRLYVGIEVYDSGPNI